MSSFKDSPSPPSDLSLAVFAKKTDFKNTVVDVIIKGNAHMSAAKGTFKIISTPDVFDEQCWCPDQQIIDFMALSLPGPNLFILAIDAENCEQEEVVVQLTKLQQSLGENVTAQLAVVTENMNIYSSVVCVKESFHSIHLATISEDLPIKCHTWCSGPFQYDYKNYSAAVVKRRKDELENNRSDCPPSYHHWGARNDSAGPSTSPSAAAATISRDSEPVKALIDGDEYFNIVLLGRTGTGKSASANTILAFGNSHVKSKNLLKSEPSSMPVTTTCNPIIVEKFKRKIRVVDTPDFFSDQIENRQAQIEECRRYCQPGQCMVLVVFQLGRFTDGEAEILEKLEETFGWRIRESAVVLLTHGDGFEGDIEKFIGDRQTLKNTVEACGNRCHVFKNTFKDPKQVIELMRKFPNYQETFPKLKEKANGKNTCSLG